MFLRWRHTKVVKAAHRKVKPDYVFKKGVVKDGQDVGGQPFFYRDYPEKITERWKVAVCESVRVDGKPRTRVVAYLGSLDPRNVHPWPNCWLARRAVMCIRELDIPVALKERFLKEIEARGVEIAWPKNLDPITPDEQAEQDAAAKIRSDELSARIGAHHRD